METQESCMELSTYPDTLPLFTLQTRKLRSREFEREAQGDLLFREAESKDHLFLFFFYFYFNSVIPPHLFNQTTVTFSPEIAS